MSDRVWTEDEVKELIQTNDVVLYGALKKVICKTDRRRTQMQRNKREQWHRI